eukprot:m.84073 g.84073  ORF g.84073 m.84073 type:complete len:213 (-) comp19683_c0_seq5:108-746(-)
MSSSEEDEVDVAEIAAAEQAAEMDLRATDAVDDLMAGLNIKAEKSRFNTHIDIRSIPLQPAPNPLPVGYKPTYTTFNTIKNSIVVHFKRNHPEVVRDPRRKIMLTAGGKAGYEQWITDGIPNLAFALRLYGERLLFADQVTRLKARGLSKPMQAVAIATMVSEFYIHPQDEPDLTERARVNAIIDNATQVVFVWTTYKDRRHLQLFVVNPPN